MSIELEQQLHNCTLKHIQFTHPNASKQLKHVPSKSITDFK